MRDTHDPPRLLPQMPAARPTLRNRLLTSERFQAFAMKVPFLRNHIRREGEAMFDLVAGFCQSQVLFALVELRILHRLMSGSAYVVDLAGWSDMSPSRMTILLRAGASLGLVRLRRGCVHLTARGAALVGVPGLTDMIAHHDVLYRDLADPVAFFRGETETELAHFWPYVFGAAQAEVPEVADRYSDLMATSQRLVAQDTLAAVSFAQTKILLDIGGGTGAFLAAVGAAHAAPQLHLFDLPAVAPAAKDRFAQAGVLERATIHAGSFHDDPIPQGADTISLIRVCYDHTDPLVTKLLRNVYDALPIGGRLVISEPMSGGDTPTRAGDAYFAIYTMAMRTGRTRTPNELSSLCREVGFQQVKQPKARRPFVTQTLICVK